MLAAVSAASTPPPARAVRKLRPSTLPDEVLRELRGQLIRGDLQPGDRIRADLVAEDLGVSVIPVREALRVLLAESRVELEPHRGYRVTVLSPSRSARSSSSAACSRARRCAAAFPRWPPPPTRACSRCWAISRRRRRVVNATDVTLWPLIAAHQDFHFVPMECAGLPRLVSELRRLWDHTDHYRSLYLFTRRVGVRADERRAPCDLRGVPRARRGRGGAAERPPPRPRAPRGWAPRDRRRRRHRHDGAGHRGRVRRRRPSGRAVGTRARTASRRRWRRPPPWRGCSRRRASRAPPTRWSPASRAPTISRALADADVVVEAVAEDLADEARGARRRRGRRSRRTRCSPPTRRACG